MADDVVQAFRRRQQVQVVVLDIHAAYDIVWQAGLLEKMTRLGLDSYLVDWTQGFLTDRVSLLEVGEAKVEIHPRCGVPQGSLVLPILFLIYIDDLLQLLDKGKWVNRQAFADDIFLWIVGSFCDGVVHPGLSRALGVVEQWSLYWPV